MKIKLGGDILPEKEQVIIKRGEIGIDLVVVIEALYQRSLIHIAPETNIAFATSDHYPGNAATIANLKAQIQNGKIELSTEELPKLAKALNILIRSGELELVIARDRFMRGVTFLALKKIEH